jgi:hypothetical protein
MNIVYVHNYLDFNSKGQDRQKSGLTQERQTDGETILEARYFEKT